MTKKIIIFTIIFVYLFNLSIAFSDVKKVKKIPLKLNAVQVFALDEVYNGDIDAFFIEASSKGIDTIMLRVFHNNGDKTHLNIKTNCSSGVYFNTEYACVVADILSDFITAAKTHNMKVFAWMASRSLSFLKEEDGGMSLAFSPDGGTVTGYGANIFKPEVREKIVNLFTDLAAYPIDGILFQDDFIIKYSEGADDYAVNLYKAETGEIASADLFFSGTKVYEGRKNFSGLKDEFYRWADWKSRYLTGLFKHIKEKVSEVNSDILFAVNIYYETPVNPSQGLAWYSQKLENFEKAGADYYAVMGYSEQIAKELGLDKNSTAIYIGKIAEKAIQHAKQPERVIMKLQSKYFWNEQNLITEKDFRIVCNYLASMKGISFAYVPIFSGSDIKTCGF